MSESRILTSPATPPPPAAPIAAGCFGYPRVAEDGLPALRTLAAGCPSQDEFEGNFAQPAARRPIAA